jgi:hypothetical protein
VIIEREKKGLQDLEIQMWKEERVKFWLLDLYAQIREAQKKIYFRAKILLGLLANGEGRKYME